MPPVRSPVGTGGGGGPFDPHTSGVGGGSVPNGLCDRESRLSFSLQAHLLRPQRGHDEMPERNHPDCLTIIRPTTEEETKGGVGSLSAFSMSGPTLVVYRINSPRNDLYSFI